MTDKGKGKQEPGRDIVITRVINAPREKVWKAWTKPERLMRWWGPKSFTAPVSRIDFRVGGMYIHCMRGPDGMDYWSTGVYREIVPLERFVATDSFADENGKVVPASHYGMTGKWPKELLVTVTFKERKSGTKMVLRHTGVPAGKMRELTRQGWEESFDKLALSLVGSEREVTIAGTTFVAEPGKQEVVYTREFRAPRERVFKVYTDPARIPQWWGPRNLTTTVEKMDVRPGGLWRFVQRGKEGQEYAFRGAFHSVKAPEQVIQTFEYEPLPGHVSLETATFKEHKGRTTLTGRTVFQTVEDRDGMLRWNMREGLAESMGRLAEVVDGAGADRPMLVPAGDEPKCAQRHESE